MHYDTEKYQVVALPNPMLLHWVLNPGIAINELLLGQRIPKITLIDKTSHAPLAQREYIPCPNCGIIHDARLWSGPNAFWHWFGLICPSCASTIPNLWNLFSLLLLALTSPIWIIIKRKTQQHYIARETARFKDVQLIDRDPDDDAKNLPVSGFLKMGFIWGSLMFLFMTGTKIYRGLMPLTEIITVAGICALGGVIFGLTLWLFTGRRKK